MLVLVLVLVLCVDGWHVVCWPVVSVCVGHLPWGVGVYQLVSTRGTCSQMVCARVVWFSSVVVCASIIHRVGLSVQFC